MIGEKDSPRRILIVALDNLGDLVFASALVPPLHRAFPHATIDVWCKDYTSAVARLIPHVTEVLAADPFWAVPPHMPRPSISRFLRSASAVHKRRYDVAVLSEAPWRVAAAVATTRIPTRIGSARHRNTACLTDVVAAQDPNKPVLKEQARLLSALGVASLDPRYALDATRLGGLRDVIARQLPPRFVALHPFAADRTRCVPLPEWIALAGQLETRGLPALWIGTARELDELRGATSGFAADIALPGLSRDQWRTARYADRLGGGALSATAAALSLASLFVGHDSGPLHVAGAFGVPVVGVFAPGQPARTFPQGVGPSRMIQRPSPDGITAATMLHEIDDLRLFSAS